MQRLRQEEVRERQKREGIDSFRQLGGNSSQLCFLKLEPRERWKDRGENGWRKRRASVGAVCITMCSNNTKEL